MQNQKSIKIGFGGGFHNCSVRYFRAKTSKNGRLAFLSARQCRELSNHMCGVAGCKCGGGYGENRCELPDGWQWQMEYYADGSCIAAEKIKE